MRLALAAVGRRMPGWVTTGCEEYAKRLPAHWRFAVREVAPGTANDAATRTAVEGAALLEAAATASGRRAAAGAAGGPHLVALDERGRSYTTRGLAERFECWQGFGRDVVLLVGGADGLHETVRTRADELWSLSPLTFPHPLVRVVVIEQLYRAHTLLSGHPYHRD